MGIDKSPLRMRLLTLALIALPLLTFAQKSKTETILEKDKVYLERTVTQISATKGDTVYRMMARNTKYSSIIDIFTLRSGTRKNVLDLLAKCMEMTTEDAKTSMDANGNFINVYEKGELMVYGKRRDDSDYVMMTTSLIDDLTKALKEFK